MDWLSGFAVVATMLILRLAIPLAVTLTVAHFIRRLDLKWHPVMTSGGDK